MKNLSVLSIGLALFTFSSCNGNDGSTQQQADVPIAQEQTVQPQAQAAATQSLPEPITAFLKQHFPDATVAGVETDRDHGSVEYEVHLNNGTQIDFDANNQWDQVEAMKGVPAYFIPKAIASYVKSNYQDMTITKVNKEYHGYEIELSNGLDLNFDRSGQFLGMDD